MKKRLFEGAGGVAVIIAALIGCQTTKPALVEPTQSAIQVEKSGFFPGAPDGRNSIDISLLFGNSDAINSWRVDLTNSNAVQRTWSGSATNLPPSLTWDGENDDGAMALEGTYTAKLSIDYAGRYQPVSVESNTFVLDITAPTGSISVDPAQFTPTETGVAGPLTLTINASSAVAHVDSWSLDVLDSAGGLVKNWSGGWPSAVVTWDGSSLSGGSVAPLATYRAVATVRDEFGNSSQLKADIPVASLPDRTLRVNAELAQLAFRPSAAAPPESGRPSIRMSQLGFSPYGDNAAHSMTFLIAYGSPSAVASWKMKITASDGSVQKTYSGDGSNLPERLSWDGTSDAGAMSPEGKYSATINVDYGAAFEPGIAASSSFILDLSPPSVSISLSAPLFSPIEGSDTISMKLKASATLAKIDSWTLDIFDPGGNVFRSFTQKWPADTAVWDGKSTAGEMVQSAEDYAVVARIRDQFGNVGTVKAIVPIDILVEKTDTGYRILASRIFFKAFTADYKNVPADLAQQNKTRLDALTTKLARYPGYKILLVGHAVMINWNKPEAGREEQKRTLIPLSKARAEAVKEALVERGLDASRFATQGVGASDQLVPDSDFKGRWENRRVALFLEKA